MEWRGLGDHRVPVDRALRARLIAGLGEPRARVHPQFHAAEHSIEALLPYISKCNPDAAIVPIGVTRHTDLAGTSARFGDVLQAALAERGLRLGHDVAFILSNDCCHYGADFQFSPHGDTPEGHQKMVEVEREIIKVCDTVARHGESNGEGKGKGEGEGEVEHDACSPQQPSSICCRQGQACSAVATDGPAARGLQKGQAHCVSKGRRSYGSIRPIPRMAAPRAAASAEQHRLLLCRSRIARRHGAANRPAAGPFCHRLPQTGCLAGTGQQALLLPWGGGPCCCRSAALQRAFVLWHGSGPICLPAGPFLGASAPMGRLSAVRATPLRRALGITLSANKTRNSLLLDLLLFDTPSLCTVQRVLGDSFFFFELPPHRR